MPRKGELYESIMSSEQSFAQNFESNKTKKNQDEQVIKQILEDTEIE
jgi:hypothetical protein